ncbi:MAG: hypothetical protein KC503_40055 [Myxococcales bacterium]|nr:hypothetical protein [Myxococcales bacterium]
MSDELQRIERVARQFARLLPPERFELRTLGTVTARERSFPLYALVIGAADRSRPTFGLFAGVHGLERVGTHVALAYLESLAARAEWEKETRRALKRARLVCMPLINPAGMCFGTRSNGNGVDLMRNAPIEADWAPPLVGGQRLSSALPWYRGSGQLEREALALIELVEQELFGARAAIALDIHSGFGFRDRLWYPYARTQQPFELLAEVEALTDLLDRAYPHHIYYVEQQSRSYTAHGDLWDYLFELRPGAQPFLPFTLEIGSWRWVRKNPWQLLSAAGVFNPVKRHRYDRTMRRHLALIDFFFRAARSSRRWMPTAAAGLSHRRSESDDEAV